MKNYTKRGAKGLLLKCLKKLKAMKVMGEVHKEIYESHRFSLKMGSLIHRNGYF